jgi:hypothetical protein
MNGTISKSPDESATEGCRLHMPGKETVDKTEPWPVSIPLTSQTADSLRSAVFSPVAAYTGFEGNDPCPV